MTPAQKLRTAAPADSEPFGYFRADAMGWTDCAATDEGAIALYERPAAHAMVAWQPISTAPKDGTKILAYIHIDDGDIGVMKWMDFGQGLAVWVWADELMGDVDPDPHQPTHWMPLPPAPVGIGKDGVEGDV